MNSLGSVKSRLPAALCGLASASRLNLRSSGIGLSPRGFIFLFLCLTTAILTLRGGVSLRLLFSERAANSNPARLHLEETWVNLNKYYNISSCSSPATSVLRPASTKLSKILSISVFYIESDRKHEFRNAISFLRYGVYPNHTSIDYIILLATSKEILRDEPKALEDLQHRLIAPYLLEASNVVIRWIENPGTDLCAFEQLFKSDMFKRYLNRASNQGHPYYSHFWLANGTVRGPIMPPWMLVSKIPWWKPFFDVMQSEPPVDAVSSYSSCYVFPHMQSMAIMMTEPAFNVAMDTWRCPQPNEDRHLWIYDNEVKLSVCLAFAGMDCRSLVGVWNGFSLRRVATMSDQERDTRQICRGGKDGNPIAYNGGYRGIYPDPYEVIFFKVSEKVGAPKAKVKELNAREQLQRDIVVQNRPEIDWKPWDEFPYPESDYP